MSIHKDIMSALLVATAWVSMGISQVKSGNCCLPPRVAKLQDSSKVPACIATCHTPGVCDDEMYPYTSQETLNLVESMKQAHAEQKQQLKVRCRSKDLLREPTKASERVSQFWCTPESVNGDDYEFNSEVNLSATNAGCTRRGVLDALIFPEGSPRLMMCQIPKNGVTRWGQLRRFISGAAGDYQAVPWSKADEKFFHFSLFDIVSQSKILSDPNWAKVALLRDPAERLLSAYLDKFVGYYSIDSPTRAPLYARKIFGIDRPITFEEFVDLISMSAGNCTANNTGLSQCTNPHWRPQAFSCRFDFALHTYSFIGRFDRVSSFSKAVLEHTGLWKKYGSKFDSGVHPGSSCRGSCKCILKTTNGSTSGRPAGFQQVANDRAGMHSKHAHEMMEKYYTPQLLEKVRTAYKMDYTLWDALLATKKDYVSGKTLLNRICFR